MKSLLFTLVLLFSSLSYSQEFFVRDSFYYAFPPSATAVSSYAFTNLGDRLVRLGSIEINLPSVYTNTITIRRRSGSLTNSWSYTTTNQTEVVIFGSSWDKIWYKKLDWYEVIINRGITNMTADSITHREFAGQE